MINVNKFLNQISKRASGEGEKRQVSSVGAVARRRRIQLHLTQAQACKDICSISYLSKIESNKIIPNEVYLDLLMEKLKIDKYEFYMLRNADETMEKIQSCFYNLDLEAYEEFYNLCSEYKENQIADVVKMGYNLLNNEPEKNNEIINTNIPLMSSMSESVFKMFTLFSMETMLALHEYNEINSLAEDLSKLGSNKTFDVLYKDFLFRLYVSEGRNILAGELYYELKIQYSQTMFIKRIERIGEYYLRTLFNSMEYEFIAKSETIATIGHEYIGKDEYNYIYGVSNFNIGNQYGAIEYLSKIDVHSPFYSKSVSYLYLCSDDHDEFLKNIMEMYKEKPDFYLL